ncbi:MAG: ABC transporter ATP-binding protein [Treponema sp.]|nr:ABC transporter ATP-binding protein [Treponema sp.]
MPPIKMRGTQKPKNTKQTILRLASYMGKFKILWLVVFLCVVASSLSEVFGTYMIKPALNDYIIPLIKKENPDLSGFIRLIVKVAAVYFVGVVAAFLNQRILLAISTRSLFNIRKDLFHNLERLPLSYYDSRPHGVIMSLFTNDTDTLRDMFSQNVPQLFTSIFSVVGVFIMMIVLSVPLTVLLCVTMALTMVLAWKIGKLSARAFRAQQENIGTVNGYIEELIEGQRVVKVFSREEATIAKFDELNEKLCEAGTQATTYASVLGPIMNNLSHLQYALCAMLGAFLVISRMSDLGTIASFLQSIRSFSRPLSQMSQQFNSILNALAGAERIFAAIDEIPEVDDGRVLIANAKTAVDSGNKEHISESFVYTGDWAWKYPETKQLKKLRGDVDFGNVDFGYVKSVKVLHDISIHAKSGEKIALVGSTGSGKTTIANLLTRFYDIEDGEGTITYDDIPIKDIEKDSLRKSLGMVLQDTHLFTGTIKENIRYGNLDATDEQVVNAAKLANADSFICHLKNGYDTVITGDGASLSQGQRQLLSIARAACANPPVLVLDEATSSIDTRTERLIQQGMDRLMRGRTVFVIAHRLSTVRNADEIIVLEKGRILERGNHDALIAKKGRYYQLYTGAFNLD